MKDLLTGSSVAISSLVLALSILESGGAITDPGELATIKAGLEEILPLVTGKSVDVIKADIKLIEDGSLSDEDKRIILGHMGVLTTKGAEAESARGIIAARIAKAIIDNAADPHGVELASLKRKQKETKKERDAREEREKATEDFTQVLSGVNDITYNFSDTALIKSSRFGGMLRFVVTPKGGKNVPGTVYKGTVNFSFTPDKFERMFEPGEILRVKFDEANIPLGSKAIPVDRVRISFKDRRGDDNGKGYTIMVGEEVDVVIPPNSEGGIVIKVDLRSTLRDGDDSEDTEYLMGGVNITPKN